MDWSVQCGERSRMMCACARAVLVPRRRSLQSVCVSVLVSILAERGHRWIGRVRYQVSGIASSTISRRMSSGSAKLSSGAEMPLVGFGTWQANDAELESALDSALSAGYRHIDTAYVYQNEHVIGKVLKRWLDCGKLTREQLFVVTKLPNIGNRPEHVAKFLDLSLSNLNLEYVDLYLIHTPFGLNYVDDNTPIPMKEDNTADLDMTTDLVAIWKKMEEQVDCGKTKAIGVSNFNIRQVNRILDVARIPPVTNQVELHVYLQQRNLEQHHKEKNVTITAYSPLGTAGTVRFLKELGVERKLPNLLTNPVVLEVARELGKTPAQVLLRHILQRGIAVIPKSTNPDRIKQNIDVFDFQLSPSQVTRLDGLDEDARILRFGDIFKNVEIHPEFPF